jgi:hypothetical protein
VGFFTGLLKVHLLQKLLGGMTRGSHAGRPGGMLSNRVGRYALAGLAALLLKRITRRR